MSFSGSFIADYKTRRDPRFNVSNARHVRLGEKSFIGYSQNIHSGAQALLATTRTQLINDAQGSGSFSSARLWNPINNRIHLLDSQVGDYIDCHVVLPFSGAPFLPSLTVQLDYSPALDGSQVVSPPQVETSFVTSGGFDYNIKFNVTSAMKANGIGIMVFASGALTVTASEVVIENLPTTTA